MLYETAVALELMLIAVISQQAVSSCICSMPNEGECFVTILKIENSVEKTTEFFFFFKQSGKFEK